MTNKKQEKVLNFYNLLSNLSEESTRKKYPERLDFYHKIKDIHEQRFDHKKLACYIPSENSKTGVTGIADTSAVGSIIERERFYLLQQYYPEIVPEPNGGNTFPDYLCDPKDTNTSLESKSANSMYCVTGNCAPFFPLSDIGTPKEDTIIALTIYDVVDSELGKATHIKTQYTLIGYAWMFCALLKDETPYVDNPNFPKSIRLQLNIELNDTLETARKRFEDAFYKS